MSILIEPDFLAPAEIEDLINQYDKGFKSAYNYRLQVTAKNIDDIRDRFVTLVGEFYNEPEIEAEHYSLIVGMPEGQAQELHADAQLKDGTPNHTPWRTHVALVYLTEEGAQHEGGALHLPQHHVTIPCKAGQLVGFPATNEYMHEVLPVTKGIRINMATWLQNPNKTKHTPS